MSGKMKFSTFMALLASMAFTLLPLSSLAQSSNPSQVYEYKLGSGDKVRVIVFGEEDLSGEFSVSGEGKVALPLIGEIPAMGDTATQLQDKITEALSNGYLKKPRVSVEILSFRPFYILGEVTKPGEYPYVNGMTIDRAVATASGYTYRANHKKAYIKRANSDREEEVQLNQGVVIQPGDTIRIAERYF
ncbi:polysaccharide biosynthesis/export family protein [Asticcacaulis excentricus]|uniref:Polysaccharide export protein n=1 Tax=Asticcacaulis excentricus (strain ATCC 15261 / DSM 4724 / KCTC 12464 / NCIMB 9791 / VKM B-1370 / CB 48) TaxID=573065 RepID=E8RM93_ASTEC|nr:polysaccharide biosynthesis/export family protein [Asticcacaulis excentricus]ADU13844.1 polysaccharide export protein [Asticcacaulis excentricus CB 48]